jgi:hypothetical protein
MLLTGLKFATDFLMQVGGRIWGYSLCWLNVSAASGQQSFEVMRRRFSSPPSQRVSPRLRSSMDDSINIKADFESTRLSVDIPVGFDSTEQIDSAVDGERLQLLLLIFFFQLVILVFRLS